MHSRCLSRTPFHFSFLTPFDPIVRTSFKSVSLRYLHPIPSPWPTSMVHMPISSLSHLSILHLHRSSPCIVSNSGALIMSKRSLVFPCFHYPTRASTIYCPTVPLLLLFVPIYSQSCSHQPLPFFLLNLLSILPTLFTACFPKSQDLASFLLRTIHSFRVIRCQTPV